MTARDVLDKYKDELEAQIKELVGDEYKGYTEEEKLRLMFLWAFGKGQREGEIK